MKLTIYNYISYGFDQLEISDDIYHKKFKRLIIYKR